ncbi:MAG: NACHT domain-containing protein [Nostocaceae cyanobacterium]|nr:NACHT domain-containing protein [Nostocaceae cyanobacterium]
MTGIEPFAERAVSGLAVPIFKMLWESGGRVLGIFGKTLNEKTLDIIFNASKQYVKNYAERHGILKVLGMKEPVNLDSIYTTVQFLDDDGIRGFASIEDLEKSYRQTNHRGFQYQKGDKQPGIKVANDKQYLMVLGSPGAGKSTFLRKIGLEALKGKKGGFKHGCIPVFIELKRFTSSDINIEQFIADEFRICGFPSPEKFTAKALEQGNLLVLLDGLDEVPKKNLTEVINQIQNFVDRYDNNRFITSCRIAAYHSNFRRFSDVTMADFDDIQIQQFIQNWFHSEADIQAKTAEKCWELLQQPENKGAKELAHTPLLLTFLCLVYDRSQNFPNNRSVLYKKALRILLEEWASEKRIIRDEIYQGLHTELEEILLSEIAYTAFNSDRLFCSQRDIVEQIKTFLASNLNAPQHLNGEAVLNTIAVQQGILVERAEDVYSFSHLTLQEYLTAQYIDDHHLVKQLVTEHLTDERWKEVFLLVAGLMRGGADELLLLMEKEAQNYINTPKLKALLNWAEQITDGSEGNFKPVGKRAVVISYIILYLLQNANHKTLTHIMENGNHIANANGIINIINKITTISNIKNKIVVKFLILEKDNVKLSRKSNIIHLYIAIFLNIIYELEDLNICNNVNFTVLISQLETLLSKIPDKKEPVEVRRAFFEDFQETLLNAFHLTPEMVDLSEEEVTALGDYLYANHLIIHCKQAAVRVSPKTWEGIEARMLLVPED